MVGGASIEKAIGSDAATEVAAMEEPLATATNVDAPKVTENQVALAGSVRCVQVMPSGEVAAMVDGPLATATKVEPPKVTERQVALTGSVR